MPQLYHVRMEERGEKKAIGIQAFLWENKDMGNKIKSTTAVHIENKQNTGKRLSTFISWSQRHYF